MTGAKGGFELTLSNGETQVCDRLLLGRADAARQRVGSWRFRWGILLKPPMPSLITFHSTTAWLHGLGHFG